MKCDEVGSFSNGETHLTCVKKKKKEDARLEMLLLSTDNVVLSLFHFLPLLSLGIRRKICSPYYCPSSHVWYYSSNLHHFGKGSSNVSTDGDTRREKREKFKRCLPKKKNFKDDHLYCSSINK